MKAPKKRSRYAACALAAFSLISAQALGQQQQPLSMTYQLLGINADPAQPVSPPVNRCAALNWVSSIGACGRDLLAKIAPRAERVPRPETFAPGAAAASEAPVASDVPESAVLRTAAPPAVELPTLGSPHPRYVRSSARPEGVIGSSRSADLMLRVGSRHRFRGSEENGWDWYRFSDMTYETHVQNNGHKAVGVELLVPFQ